MDSENAIELRDVSLTYSYKYQDETETNILGKPRKRLIDNHVIDHIDLDVKKGEILGIIGVNGAGKSTLLKIMARILEPDTGTVEVSGKVATILELGMGFHNDLSGRENIVLKGELYGFSKKEIQSKIDSIIAYSGLRNYIDNPIRTYSSGMRSRLAFAIMVHVDAEIMLVDEILSTGDASFSIKAKDYFKKILKDGKTVVYVSHSPGSVESICNRAIWLSEGKIIADGSPKKVSAKYLEATTESFEVVKDQAESGLASAQLNLAHFYRDGKDVEENQQLYEEWLRKAADQGLIEAQVEYANLLIEQKNEDSLHEALTYYQIAADAGNPEARLKLASIIGEKGIGERQQVKEIMKRIALEGNPDHIFKYATFLIDTATNEDDRKEAFRNFKLLADNYDHPDAIIMLSKMYLRGVGVRKNMGQYVDVVRKGSNLGIIEMMIQMADLLMAGVYVEKDEKAAFQLYLNCATNGSNRGQYNVASMYNSGVGVEPDKEKAKEWFRIYYQTQLSTYQLQTVNILKARDASDPLIDELYRKIEKTSNIKVQISLVKDYTRNKPEYNLEPIYSKFSKIYGRTMWMAFKYYVNDNPDSRDCKKIRELCEKMRYLGNPLVEKTMKLLDDEDNLGRRKKER